MNLRIQITIEDKNGQTEVHPVDMDVEMPENGPMIIDQVEQELLRVNRAVILTTISTYLEELSKKARFLIIIDNLSIIDTIGLGLRAEKSTIGIRRVDWQQDLNRISISSHPRMG